MSIGVKSAGWLVLPLCLLVLSACMAPPPAPVVERDQPPSTKINYHIVSAGDTLHTIAWRYELDHEQLASLNDLSPPYQLHNGQRLLLGESAAYVASTGARAVPVTTSPISAEAITVEPVTSEELPRSDSAVSGEDMTASPGSSQSADEQVAIIQPTPSTASPTDPVPPAPSASGASVPWQWPVTGAVSREYDANKVFKGININSSKGAQVQAAAAGVVVYAGSGLRGYGQLIILKHNDTYLSAYAHNHKILVNENQDVSQGQVIGEVGGDPADPGRLYFEIREHGKPVDPEKLLPRQ